MKTIFLALSAAGMTFGLPASPQSSPDNNEGQVPVVGLGNITRVSMGGVEGRSVAGPHLGIDFPDPSIIFGDGSWKAYGTSSNGRKVPVATSADRLSWGLAGNDALPNPGPWANAREAIWAPDVQKNDAGVYVMYYAALRNGGARCIGVATSRSALGPFAPNDSPLICDDGGGGAIDPAGYDDGVDRWIMWKVDGNNLGGATTCQPGNPTGSAYRSTPIRIQRMARDALTLLGSPRTILDNEGRNNDGVVEGPSLYKIANGNYILFYSAHCYSSDDYDIEYAFSSTIDGAYTNRGILLRTVDNRGVFGPGGLDLDPNGRSVLFHGRLGPNQGGGAPRQLYSAEITINGRSVSL